MARCWPTATDSIGRTGPCWLARIAHHRLGTGVRFLPRNFWLAKGGRRCRSDWHISAILRGGQTIGGMFNKPATAPASFWLYYFNVADIGAALDRVRAGRGKILEGPTEIPGGGGSPAVPIPKALCSH